MPRRVQGFAFRDGTVRRIDLEPRRFGSVRRNGFGPASDVDVLVAGGSIIALENEGLILTRPTACPTRTEGAYATSFLLLWHHHLYVL